MRKILDSTDYAAYEDDPERGHRIRPMSDWRDAVAENLLCPAATRGLLLPWPKTRDLFRLREGEVTAWTGLNFSGKSAVLSMIKLGLCAQGAKCLTASMEMRPEATIERALRQFSCRNEPSVRDLDRFMAWTDDKAWIYDHVGSVTVPLLLPALRYAVEELGVSHVIIDSLMRLGISGRDEDAQQKALESLCVFAHDYNCHVHLVAHNKKPMKDGSTQDRFDMSGFATLSNQADNIVLVIRNEDKEKKVFEGRPVDVDDPDTRLFVNKQRHGSSWTGHIGLWFDAYSGQWLERPSEKGGRAIDLTSVGGREREAA